MLERLFRRGHENERIASGLYGAIVAQARAPALYADLGVPDTVSGRFEMVVLHTVLVVDRLKGGGAAERMLGQRIFDLFCADMDRSLRDLGIGDLSVPKRMKQMAESFYGRAAVYGGAFAGGDAAGLTRALARNLFGGSSRASAPLARYAIAAAAGLAERSATARLGAPLVFPDPAAFVGTEAES